MPDEPKSEGPVGHPTQTSESAISVVPTAEAERVEREVAAYVDRAPPPVREMLMARLVQYSGPLPPPEMIEAYNKVVPGMGRELLDAFLEEGKHRRGQNTKQLDLVAEDTRSRRKLDHRGMSFGAIIGIIGMVGSMVLIFTGHDIAGGFIGGAELTALVSIFVVGRPRKKQRDTVPTESANRL